jgi:hypothetical protein
MARRQLSNTAHHPTNTVRLKVNMVHHLINTERPLRTNTVLPLQGSMALRAVLPLVSMVHPLRTSMVHRAVPLPVSTVLREVLLQDNMALLPKRPMAHLLNLPMAPLSSNTVHRSSPSEPAVAPEATGF